MFKINIDENKQINVNNKNDLLNTFETYLKDSNIIQKRKVNQIYEIVKKDAEVWFDVLNNLSRIQNTNGYVMRKLIDAIEKLDNSLIKVD